ncbi:choice-of-anchor B family protein [Aquimarina sp. 2201CG5-10]|uniref:choice-of-anchor B family protein n=1 Tax=Aquimarina callyspongiae TaxID=3098150 RepID=UPI002AB490A5|nr:choice-of-anchor B family protein [Aquimarina sp. 2201CG5-10]MDY8135083.1 choice-of-anchor B family protein [Aquimarina sp. 2201CG5-10]
MKILTITLSFLLLTFVSYSQTPCTNGFAGSYPCNDYDLMSHITLSTMNAGAGNDSWGWTDPTNGREYAIIGLNNGTAFIDISDPVNPIYLGKLPTATSNSSWRDVKVYKDHAFIVSEASNHGMQVFDLTRLRNVANPPQNFTADTRYTEFGNAHNIVINEDSGYAYVVGAQRNSGPYRGGPLFINIQDPKNPTNAGGFLSGGQRAYTHDAQVVTYNGPDSNYTGREILIGSNEIEVVIADITNKANPVTISTIKYSDVGYTHQGWFTEDMRYFILGDETDEQGVGFNTRTIIFDFQDLDNPQQHMIYNGPTAAIDHNGYVKGNKFYLANYRAGIRVIDISDIGNKNITEIGSFDTYPSSNGAAFNGVWNVYPYFNSGNIVISDIEGGFFLVRKSATVVCQATTPSSVSSSNVGATSATVSWGSVAAATYDVRYRATGTSAWTTNTSSGTSYVISGLSPTTQYEAQVRSKCSDGSTSQYSNSVTFTTTSVQLVYCDSNGNSVSDEYISNVAIGTINNASGASNGGYIDYTSISTDLKRDDTHTITVTPTWTGTVYSEGYSVWIDFNQDGDFSDSGEQVWTQTATQNTPVAGNFSIPASALNGTTRMRVSMKYNGVPSPCESFQYGEVEDYTVNIIEGGGSGGDGCTSGISSFPYNEGFENTVGAWVQSTADDINWSVDANGTPSRNTGPSSATQGTYYIYVEASGNGTGYPNKRAIINSPCFDLSAQSSATFSFAYHMYGATNMGSIALEASADDGASWTSLWSQTGNQGNSWKTVNIDLAAYTGAGVQLRFNRITGSTWQADIAIDNVALTTSASRVAISAPEKTTLTIFPNPVQGAILNVSMNHRDVSEYEIKNFVGQLVSKGTVTNTIDISTLNTGVYFLQVITNGEILSKRFVKK